jgi:hypothetical protein
MIRTLFGMLPSPQPVTETLASALREVDRRVSNSSRDPCLAFFLRRLWERRPGTGLVRFPGFPQSAKALHVLSGFSGLFFRIRHRAQTFFPRQTLPVGARYAFRRRTGRSLVVHAPSRFATQNARSIPRSSGQHCHFSTSVKWRRDLSQRQILGAYFTTHLVGLELERDLLALSETGKTGSFDRADVHKHIISAVVRLNEAKTLLAVEPLDSTCRHFSSPKRIRVTSRDLDPTGRMSLGRGPQARSERHCGELNPGNVGALAAKHKGTMTNSPAFDDQIRGGRPLFNR